jgi:hypothetical protein
MNTRRPKSLSGTEWAERGAPHSLQRSAPEVAKPSRPQIFITQQKLRSKAVLPPLAWAAGWARKPDKPEPGSTS